MKLIGKEVDAKHFNRNYSKTEKIKWNEHEMSITELPKWETSEGWKDIYKIWQREPVFGALG